MALGRRLRSGSSSVPELREASNDVDRKSVPYPDLKPEVKFPALATHATGERIEDRLGGTSRRPDRLFQSAGGCRLRRRSIRSARHGQARDEHARRGHEEARRRCKSVTNSRAWEPTSAPVPTSIRRTSLSPHLKSNLDRVVGDLCRCDLEPVFPGSGFRALEEAATGRDSAREDGTEVHGDARFPDPLFGKSHAYGNPLTGSGTEESVDKMTRLKLEKFHQTWFKPNNATLIVVGDTTVEEILPKLEKLFAGWKRGDVPKKNIARSTVRRQVRRLPPGPAWLHSVDHLCRRIAPRWQKPTKSRLKP